MFIIMGLHLKKIIFNSCLLITERDPYERLLVACRQQQDRLFRLKVCDGYVGCPCQLAIVVAHAHSLQTEPSDWLSL